MNTHEEQVEAERHILHGLTYSGYGVKEAEDLLDRFRDTIVQRERDKMQAEDLDMEPSRDRHWDFGGSPQ